MNRWLVCGLLFFAGVLNSEFFVVVVFCFVLFLHVFCCRIDFTAINGESERSQNEPKHQSQKSAICIDMTAYS